MKNHHDHNSHQGKEQPLKEDLSEKKLHGHTKAQHNRSHHHKAHSNHKGHHAHMLSDFKKRFWISLFITIPILALSEMIQMWFGFELVFPGYQYVLGALGTYIYFYGGWPFLKGLVDEIKERSPGMMTLIGIAITVAWAYSFAITLGFQGMDFYWELATLIVIMLLGHWLEMKSVLGASKSLEKLVELMPDKAYKILETGELQEVGVKELESGDKIQIKPGEKVPADGIVLEGSTSINESMLTGESMPVEKKKNDKVIAGSVNEAGTIAVQVKKASKESYLSKVIDLVKEAQKSKSKTQRLADKAAFVLTIVALAGGFITFFAWYFIADRELVFAVERMVTVMVISCPHALGLAIPLVVAISTAISAKQGLLIRNRSSFEMSRKIDVIIFDKTGTLTKGKFGVSNIKSLDQDWDKSKILQWAASLEQNSEHPLASGVLKKAKEEKLSLIKTENFTNITGQGVQAKIEGKEVVLAGPKYLEAKNMQVTTEPTEIETIIYLIVNGQPKGYLTLADVVRPESKDAIRILHENNIDVLMATGDNERVAKAVSEELRIEGYYANVLPEEKQKKIKELQKEGKKVAMTGDGVNDAPALAQADVGIAVGSGTDVAAETADIILVNSNPKDIVNLILFGKATYRKMVQNLIWATAYNVVTIPLAAGVLYNQGIVINPAIGAMIMSISTIIVAINAQFLKFSATK
jgi:P-type Cu2+ transporter